MWGNTNDNESENKPIEEQIEQCTDSVLVVVCSEFDWDDSNGQIGAEYLYEDCDEIDIETPDSSIDFDGDGFTENRGDCDDTDPHIYSGAEDTWYDGIDSDCDENNDYDKDKDGFVPDEYAEQFGNSKWLETPSRRM